MQSEPLGENGASLCFPRQVHEATEEDIERIYRYMAEGDLREAMAEMKHVFDFLRTPDAECGLMASIAAGNAKHG